jgi:MAE_28990/MAE_18760-like HEPN
MISDQIHQTVDTRLAEVQRTLALVEKLEASAANENDPVSAENAATLRGLFYVHLYGALEYSITLSVQVLLQEMTKTTVRFSDYDHMLHAVILDDHFRSLAEPGLKLRWPKRRELLAKQISSEPCSLNDTVFQDQLQNLWYKTLHSIFEYLCIPRQAVPEDRMRGYIDEIVDNRNAIAHGRQAAQEVGRRVTSTDLKERFDAITKVVNHVLETFDDYLETRHFIAPSHRAPYLLPLPAK